MSKRNKKMIKKGKIFGTLEKPRIIIVKSNCFLTAEAIDDEKQKTLAQFCTRKLNSTGSENRKSNEFAIKLAEEFSKILNEKKINSAVFDRRTYKYHGIVKTFREKIQELGIKC
jgi:large subunit ribosomal protein L18